MSKHKTAYELARSQVTTPLDVIRLFWRITHDYRSHFSRVLDLGSGDGRFAVGGRYGSYEGVEIDVTRRPIPHLPPNSTILNNCAFELNSEGYSACIGNPPYVRHHDIEKKWRNAVARRLSKETGFKINRKCNLYVYFLFLALQKTRADGLVSVIVPYEWVSRPSAHPLRSYIKKNKWHVDTYRFQEAIFDGVLTTASISVIDKRNRDSQWLYHQIDKHGTISQDKNITGSNREILPYENRGELWAMRGMSPGTQKVFTLSEGERIHAGLRHDDVLPCVTSLRDVPSDLSRLTQAAFHRCFIEIGAKCWLIKSHTEFISPRLQAYLDYIPEDLRNTWTCKTREPWYRYPLFDAPKLLVSTGFTSFGPKVLLNSVNAHAIGSVSGIYSNTSIGLSQLRAYLTGIDFEKRVVAHANKLKKVEIRQLNTVLNRYWQRKKRYAQT